MLFKGRQQNQTVNHVSFSVRLKITRHAKRQKNDPKIIEVVELSDKAIELDMIALSVDKGKYEHKETEDINGMKIQSLVDLI